MSSASACIHIETENEAEMKRVKYLLNKEGVTTPEGIIFFIHEKSNKDIEHLVNRLMAKTSSDRVHLYRMKAEEIILDEITRTISTVLEGTKESVEKIARFLVSKRKGTLQSSGIGGAKRYKAYTKKGNVEIMTKIKEHGTNQYELSLKIRGFKDAAQIIYEEFKRELEFFE